MSRRSTKPASVHSLAEARVEALPPLPGPTSIEDRLTTARSALTLIEAMTNSGEIEVKEIRAAVAWIAYVAEVELANVADMLPLDAMGLRERSPNAGRRVAPPQR
jgi:hypothetical protein